MEKLTLLSIDSDGSDVYVTRSLLDGNEVGYKFSYVVGAFGDRVLQHEDKFYLDTFDDPAAEWLEKSIQAFDRSRVRARSESRPEPVNLLIDKGNKLAQEYRVVFDGGTDELIKVNEQSDTRTAAWQFGTCVAKLEPPGLWITDSKSDPLLQAVLMLHQASYPKYKTTV